jgi:anaerobic magnesium-protoporphyrin IX monomethyl ester cyclase
LRGEGEVSLAPLASAVKGGHPVGDVPGAVWRTPDGVLQIRPPAAMGELDRFPPPDLGQVDHLFYRRGKRGAAVVVASRGCPMTCSYCCLGADSYLTYRRRSVASVLAEMEDAVVRFGAGFIDFEDENIALDRTWFLELLAAIDARFGREVLELRAMNGLFPPTLDREVVEAMKRAGFRSLNLSLGATRREQLHRFRRPDVRRAFDRALDMAQFWGLDSVGYVIAGAPFQTPEDSLTDLLYLARRRVLAGVSVFYPAPGSSDFIRCRQLDLLPQSLLLWRSSALPISHTTTRMETVTLLRLARILNFMKSLIDSKIPLPGPMAPAEMDLAGMGDRTEIGKLLLSGFLHDGRIRGVDPEGRLFEHTVSLDLTRRFVNRLKRVPVRGTR